MDETTLRQTLIEVGRRVYDRGWTPAHDGNLSVRIDADWILTTRSGCCKGMLTAADLVVVAADGTPRDATAPAPSSELPMHLAVYRARPDVHACVHAHPPLAIACSVAGVSLEPAVLPEIILTLGKIPTVPYVQTGTTALADAVALFMTHHDAVVLAHHGTVSIGTSLLQAFHRTAQIEQTARILITAHQLGAIRRLPRQDVIDLLTMRRQRGGNLESEPPTL